MTSKTWPNWASPPGGTAAFMAAPAARGTAMHFLGGLSGNIRLY